MAEEERSGRWLMACGPGRTRFRHQRTAVKIISQSRKIDGVFVLVQYPMHFGCVTRPKGEGLGGGWARWARRWDG